MRAEVTKELVREAISQAPSRASGPRSASTFNLRCKLPKSSAAGAQSRVPVRQGESIRNAEELQQAVDEEMSAFVARWARQARHAHFSRPSHRGVATTPPSTPTQRPRPTHHLGGDPSPGGNQSFLHLTHEQTPNARRTHNLVHRSARSRKISLRFKSSSRRVELSNLFTSRNASLIYTLGLR